MKYKVRATDKYVKFNVEDKELGKVLQEDEEFIIDDARLKVLTGDNRYSAEFVEVIEEIKSPRKRTKKGNTKDGNKK